MLEIVIFLRSKFQNFVLGISPPPRFDDRMRISEERLSQCRLSEEKQFREKIEEIQSDTPGLEHPRFLRTSPSVEGGSSERQKEKIKIEVPRRSPSCDSYSHIRRVHISREGTDESQLSRGSMSRSLSLSPGAVRKFREMRNGSAEKDAHTQAYTIPRVVKAIGSFIVDSSHAEQGKQMAGRFISSTKEASGRFISGTKEAFSEFVASRSEQPTRDATIESMKDSEEDKDKPKREKSITYDSVSRGMTENNLLIFDMVKIYLRKGYDGALHEMTVIRNLDAKTSMIALIYETMKMYRKKFWDCVFHEAATIRNLDAKSSMVFLIYETIKMYLKKGYDGITSDSDPLDAKSNMLLLIFATVKMYVKKGYAMFMQFVGDKIVAFVVNNKGPAYAFLKDEVFVPIYVYWKEYFDEQYYTPTIQWYEHKRETCAEVYEVVKEVCTNLKANSEDAVKIVKEKSGEMYVKGFDGLKDKLSDEQKQKLEEYKKIAGEKYDEHLKPHVDVVATNLEPFVEKGKMLGGRKVHEKLGELRWAHILVCMLALLVWLVLPTSMRGQTYLAPYQREQKIRDLTDAFVKTVYFTDNEERNVNATMEVARLREAGFSELYSQQIHREHLATKDLVMEMPTENLTEMAPFRIGTAISVGGSALFGGRPFFTFGQAGEHLNDYAALPCVDKAGKPCNKPKEPWKLEHFTQMTTAITTMGSRNLRNYQLIWFDGQKSTTFKATRSLWKHALSPPEEDLFSIEMFDAWVPQGDANIKSEWLMIGSIEKGRQRMNFINVTSSAPLHRGRPFEQFLEQAPLNLHPHIRAAFLDSDPESIDTLVADIGTRVISQVILGGFVVYRLSCATPYCGVPHHEEFQKAMQLMKNIRFTM